VPVSRYVPNPPSYSVESLVKGSGCAWSHHGAGVDLSAFKMRGIAEVIVWGHSTLPFEHSGYGFGGVGLAVVV
jgi:hypothetical protein